MSYFLHLSNVIWIICFVVRDVLALRLLAILAMCAIMPYYYAHKQEPMWEPIVWNLLFMAINLYWVVVILLERRPPRFTPEQRKLYDLTFRACPPRKMLQLLSVAECKTAKHNEVLIEQGRAAERLLVILDGSAQMRSGGQTLAYLSGGDFVGEMSYLTGRETTAEVVAQGEVRYVCWTRSVLRRLFETRVDLQAALHEVIGLNLIDKLSAVIQRAPQKAPDLSAIFKSI